MSSGRAPSLKLALPILCISTLLGGCVVSQQDYQTLQSRVYTQEKKQQAMEKRLAVLDSELETAEGRLKAEIHESSSPVRSTQANLWAEIEQLKMRVATLQGEFESFQQQARQQGDEESVGNSAKIAELSEEIASIRIALESQLALDVDAAKEMEAPSGKMQEASSPATPEASLDPAKAVYDQALALFKDRQYEEAQSLWADFVRDYPKHGYVPNAVFWQGECFYQLKDYARAVLSYQEVITKYPKSSKYAPAMLKQGISFIKLGKDNAGKVVLEELVKKKPNSAEAKRAKAFLK